MKDQNVERKELFKAFFEDKDFSKEQLEKAKESVKKQRLTKKQKDKLKKTRELQYRLNARQNELLSEALGIDNISEDKEIKKLVDDLKKTYDDFKKASDDSDKNKLSIDICPELPDLEDYMSRIHKGEDNDFSPLNIQNDQEIIGTDDYDHPIYEDGDEAMAESEGGVFHVSADSKKESGSIGESAEARASVFFPLITGYVGQKHFANQYKELCVKAHFFGDFKGEMFGDNYPEPYHPPYARAWIQMNLGIWNGIFWKRVDSEKVNLMNIDTVKANSAVNRIPRTSFDQRLKVSSKNLPEKHTGRSKVTFRISVTAGAEALCPLREFTWYPGAGYSAPIQHPSRAYASLSTVLCAIDIGIKPITIFPYEVRGFKKHPLIDFLKIK